MLKRLRPAKGIASETIQKITRLLATPTTAKGTTMPNWCENTLFVRGTKKDLEAFLLQAQRREGEHYTALSFENFFPVPQQLVEGTAPCRDENLARENTEKYGYPDWYHWCIGNWGVKWPVNAVVEWVNQKELVFSFDSPWDPPDVFIDRVSMLFPQLTFENMYVEPGMAYRGHMIVCVSEGIKNESRWNMTRDDWEDLYPDLAAEMFDDEGDGE